MKENIQPFNKEHLDRYGEIYAAAFAGEPWNDYWKIEDAIVHIKELADSKQAFGLEYVVGDQVAGFIVGTSTLFHYGRVFDISDLAVAPEYQKQGIGKRLLNELLEELKKQGMVVVHLITAPDGGLPNFYNQFGFDKEEVILMGKDL